MKREFHVFIFLLVVSIGLSNASFGLKASLPDRVQKIQKCLDPWLAQSKGNLYKKVLPNGLTILVYEKKDTPNVHLRVAYRVGSKDERVDQFGFAHMVEHMIFKGTQKLAESDIWRLSRAFCTGGSCNAFTWYDTTCYHFNTDKNHWPMFVEVLADCMENARFDEHHFASEVKAVFQEIKERNCDGVSNIFGMLLPENHPYFHPVIGYKEDLLGANASELRAFFKENYTPDKAALIVTGNVNPQELFEKAQACFGHIPSSERVENDKDLCSLIPRQKELFSKHVTVYRPVESSKVSYIWALPGYSSLESEAVKQMFTQVLAKRLSRILVDEKEYVHSVNVGCSAFLLENFFSISFTPKDKESLSRLSDVESIDQVIDRCYNIITKEIASMAHDGMSEDEQRCVLLQLQSDDVRSFLSIDCIAHMLHDLFLKQESYDTLCEGFQALSAVNNEQLKSFGNRYLRDMLRQSITILPIPESEKNHHALLQQAIDEHDTRVLSQQSRSITKSLALGNFELPQPILLGDTVQKPDIEVVLDNGLHVIISRRAETPFISTTLQFNNRIDLSRWYAIQDQPDIPGLAMQLLLEGTKKYSKKELEDFSQTYAAHIHSSLYGVSWESLPCDQEIVSSRIRHILTSPLLPSSAIDKEKSDMLALIEMNKESAGAQLNKLIRGFFYAQYPWITINDEKKRAQINAITRKSLQSFIEQYVQPENMTLIMVGNINLSTIKEAIVKTWGSWQSGSKVQKCDPTTVPIITNPLSQELHTELPKDQVYLVAARLTIENSHEDACGLKMLDRYIGARLFELRERTGIFYGSDACIAPSDGDTISCGYLRMMVLPTQVNQAKLLLKELLATFAQKGLTQEEFMFAKHRLSADYAQSIADAGCLLNHYVYCLEYGHSWDYYEKQLAHMQTLSREQVNKIAQKYCNPDNWSIFTVGRKVDTSNIS